MVKIRKNKSKLQNKPSKVEKNEITSAGRITKKKSQAGQNRKSADKSIIKELASHSNDLVDLKTSGTKMQLRFAKSLVSQEEKKPPQPKKKPVEKQKKRQKTQIDDTKMLLKLMKKK